MSQPAQTVQKTNGSVGIAILKLVMILVALGAFGYSMATIDLPNKNYIWMAVEVLVALLLIQSAIGIIRRLFRS